MDTSPPGGDNPVSPTKPDSPSPSADDVHGPNLDLSPQDVPAGMRVNENGMLEKTTFTKMYRVDSGVHRDAILAHGFEPSAHFGGIGKMISGDAVIVSETLEGAQAFGDGEFGAGHYDVYEIDASGFKGASLKDNVDDNTAFTARQLGRTPEALKKMPPREVAEGALEFREAHIDAAAARPPRIHLIERGVPRPPSPSDSDSSAHSA